MKTRDYVASKLPEEFRVLHAISKKKVLPSSFQSEVRWEVQRHYNNLVSKKTDKLEAKLGRWGNSGRWARMQIDMFERAIYDGKGVPDTSFGNWLSVEIECIFPDEHTIDSFAKFCRKNGYTKFVTLKDDGSIHVENEERCGECSGCEDEGECNNTPSGPVGKEIVVSFELGKHEILLAICQFLNQSEVTVNKTCGLHVHFDCRGLTSRKVTYLATRLARCVPALKLMLPKSRRDNSFCREDVNTHRTGNRYAFVNVQSFKKHETLEVRGHSGTIDAGKIINWIQILKTIMESKKVRKCETIHHLLEAIRFSDDLKKYILMRSEKFSDKTPETSYDDITQDHETLVAIAA